MPLSSQAIADRRVYAQDIEPTDTRSGNIWVDTRYNPPEIKVYSPNTNSWEGIQSVTPTQVTDETLNFGETDVTITHDNTRIVNGNLTTGNELAGSTQNGLGSKTDNSKNLNYSTQYGLEFTVHERLHNVTLNFTNPGDFNTVNIDRVGGGRVNPPLSPGDYVIWASASYSRNNVDTWKNPNLPIEGDKITITGGYGGNSDTNIGSTKSISADTFRGDGTATIEWSSATTDIASWDIINYQNETGDGSFTVNVQANDGSGWTTALEDISDYGDISAIDPTNDVRLEIQFNKSNQMMYSMPITYASRRFIR